MTKPNKYDWHRRFVFFAYVEKRWVFFRRIAVRADYYFPWREWRRLKMPPH